MDTLPNKCENCTTIKQVLQQQLHEAERNEQQLRDAERNVETLNRTVETLNTKLSLKDNVIQYLDERNRDLNLNYVSLEKRSKDITSQMAGLLETKGGLENLGDDCSNTKLSQRFEEIYDKSWVSLLEWFVENTDKDEQEVIQYLSILLEKCYDLCVRQADEQIRRFFLLSEEDEIPSEHAHSNLYRCRRLGGQSTKQRDRIIQIVVEVLVKSEAFTSFLDKSTEEPFGKLEMFFKDYTDCCWLMTISQPPMVLNFKVAGLAYARKLTETFLQYSTQEKVIDKTMCKGTIMLVVWPSVSTKDGALMYTKGSVITVDDGKVETD